MAMRLLARTLSCALLSVLPAHAQCVMSEEDKRPELMPEMLAWTPLDPARIGAELFERWVPVPDGTSGAPRQGWLITADGFFTREHERHAQAQKGALHTPGADNAFAECSDATTRRRS